MTKPTKISNKPDTLLIPAIALEDVKTKRILFTKPAKIRFPSSGVATDTETITTISKPVTYFKSKKLEVL